MPPRTTRKVVVAVAMGNSREIRGIPNRTSATLGKSTMTRYDVKGRRFTYEKVRFVTPCTCVIPVGEGDIASSFRANSPGRTTVTVTFSVKTLHPVPTACHSSRFSSAEGWSSAFVTV